jgi:hypothetical protein
MHICSNPCLLLVNLVKDDILEVKSPPVPFQRGDRNRHDQGHGGTSPTIGTYLGISLNNFCYWSYSISPDAVRLPFPAYTTLHYTTVTVDVPGKGGVCCGCRVIAFAAPALGYHSMAAFVTILTPMCSRKCVMSVGVTGREKDKRWKVRCANKQT